MKINNYELGEHCFGEILRTNGIDYEDLDKDELKDFIFDMLEEDMDKDLLLRDLIKTTLSYLQLEIVESHYDGCDQCGNYND